MYVNATYYALMEIRMLTMTGYGFGNECKEIHDSWGRLNQLIGTLSNRTRVERQQIRETYKAIYGEDLVNRLLNAEMISRNNNDTGAAGFSPKLCAALSMFMLEPHERDAVVAREALEQSTDHTSYYKPLMEIFVGRKSSQIFLTKQAYYTRYRRHLNQHIANTEPPSSYQKILIALVASHNAHHTDVSQHIAKCDAKRLYETGEGSPGAVEEAVILEILSKRSIPQMKLTFSSYKRIYGHDYVKSLKRGSSSEFKNALKMVVKCTHNPTHYYAKALNGSIKGRSENKDGLARLLVSQSEVDEMNEIRKAYKNKYGTELRDVICESIPSGDYRDFLVALATN